MKKNFPIKISAVVLAVIMWLFVISRGQTEVSMQVPVLFSNIPEGVKVVGDSAESVVVDIRGHERFVKNLRPGDVKVVLDASGVGPGPNSLRISPGDVRLPAPLKLMGVRPSTVDLNAEKVFSKSVPVNAVLEGRPRAGFSISRVEVLPGEVAVRGLKRELRYVSTLMTEPVDLDGVENTVVREVRLVNPGADVDLEPSSVKVRVIIMKEAR